VLLLYQNEESMKQAFIKLHLSILLAGFTGIFGKLISLNEGLLVWYRLLFASIIFFIVLKFYGKLKKVTMRDAVKIGLVGFVLSTHWVFFYGSIKASNVSIGVVVLSLMGFFSSIFEPFIMHRGFRIREMGLSLIAVLGVVLIFSFDTRYRLGIGLGVVSSMLCSLYSILNKKVGRLYSSGTMLLYQMIGGLVCLSFLMPVYLHFFTSKTMVPLGMDFIYMIIYVLFCTIALYVLQIQALKSLSAFTVNLSYNLEPVYSIIIAMILFHESKDLNFSFWVGMSMIVISVLWQMYFVAKEKSLNV
jgi:drug/metabolite transporter (DMT)-like permease